MALIRGTTPTIQFTFNDIDVSQIQVAYLFVKQRNTAVIAKDLTSATVGENDISWVLTQEETLALEEKQMAKIVCDWRTSEGLRGRSNIITTDVESSGIDEVI